MNIIKEGSELPVDNYLILLKSFYEEKKETSVIHIDTLVILYKVTKDEGVFTLLFRCHYYLLIKILREKYNKFRGFLYDEDYNELKQMLCGEFYRRVLFYSIPPDAPFSKYIKLYLRKWLGVYTKLLVDKNKRFILNVDWKNGDI